MTPAQAIHKFEHLRRFTRDGERAVHKPLLALLILGRIAARKPLRPKARSKPVAQYPHQWGISPGIAR